MFRIKICGIRSREAAEACIAAGADAVGLNFYPKSRRFILPDEAAAISRAIAGKLLRIGVFVSSSPEQIRDLADSVGLDAVQLHGEEPPETLAALQPWPVIKAFRVRDSCRMVGDYLEDCQALGVLPAAVLLDTWAADAPGGTGKTFDWSTASEFVRNHPNTRVVLAGGLRPENVGEAVRIVRPYGVDTAGGVESPPGEKSPDLIAAFVQAARSALLGSPQ